MVELLYKEQTFAVIGAAMEALSPLLHGCALLNEESWDEIAAASLDLKPACGHPD